MRFQDENRVSSEGESAIYELLKHNICITHFQLVNACFSFPINFAVSITPPFVEFVACECIDSCCVLSHDFCCLLGHALFQHLPPVTRPQEKPSQYGSHYSILNESLSVNRFISYKLPGLSLRPQQLDLSSSFCRSEVRVDSLFRTKSFDFSNLAVLILSGTGVDDKLMLALAEKLHNAPALKQVDLSANPELHLLPVGMLQIAASLERFKCDGCSLQLPPHSFFSTPEENPSLIRQLLECGASETVLTLSNVCLEPTHVAVLRHYPALKMLDISNNPGLGCRGASSILSSLAGMRPPLRLHLCV
jgi:hypothetical protein